MSETPPMANRGRLKALLMAHRKFHRNATFSQIGGARTGLSHSSWPFPWLAATREEISVRCWFNYTFPKGRIQRLSWHRGWFSTGLRIEHDIPDYAPFFVFWPPDLTTLERGLAVLAYEIHGKP